MVIQESKYFGCLICQFPSCSCVRPREGGRGGGGTFSGGAAGRGGGRHGRSRRVMLRALALNRAGRPVASLLALGRVDVDDVGSDRGERRASALSVKVVAALCWKRSDDGPIVAGDFLCKEM